MGGISHQALAMCFEPLLEINSIVAHNGPVLTLDARTKPGLEFSIMEDHPVAVKGCPVPPAAPPSHDPYEITG